MSRVIPKIIITIITVIFTTTMPTVPLRGRGTTAGNMQNGGYAVESDDWIYYYANGNLYKTQQGMEDQEILIENIDSMLPYPFWGNLNVMGDWIYFSTMHGSVYKVPTSGGRPQAFISGQTKPYMVGVCEFLIVDDWFYYNYETTEPSKMERSSMICRMRLDGSDDQVLLGDDGKGNMFWLLDVADGFIYYNGIRHKDQRFYDYRMPIEGGKPERLDFIPYAAQIQVVDGWIYYCDSSGSLNIQRTRTDGSETQIIYDQGFCNSINVVGDWIYCFAGLEKGDYDNRFYMRIKTNGRDMQILNEEQMFQCSVAGDVVCSMLEGAMRIREDNQVPYLEQISAGLRSDRNK